MENELKQIGWETPTGAVMSFNDYSFLPIHQQMQCKPYYGAIVRDKEASEGDCVASVPNLDVNSVASHSCTSRNSNQQ